MGRPAVVIVVMGLGACLALSWTMRTALNLASDKQIPLEVKTITQHFGHQIEGPPRYWVEEDAQGLVGNLLVEPLFKPGAERLALTLGQFLWRCCAMKSGIDTLVVSCDQGEGRVLRYVVNAPRKPGRSIRQLGPGEAANAPALEPLETSIIPQAASGKRP